MFIKFIKSLMGQETFEESLIGLAKFEYKEVSAYDETPKKKKVKSGDIPLSQMLKRMS